ncbi:methyl-accepting chemotaxis protein [Salinispira pacifica]|nr:methyl-accepting chemotaxis protein [Salinispira pacifica]
MEYHFSKQDEEGSFRKMGYIKEFSPLDWKIIYTFYVDDVVAQVQSFRIFLIILGLAGLILIGGILFGMLTYVQRTLLNISQGLGTISQGTGDLTFRLPVRSRDEIGSLSENFNLMMEKLQNIVIKLKSTVSDSEVLGEDLSASTEEISTAVVEMSATGQSIKGKSQNLSGESDSVERNLNHIIDSMRGLADAAHAGDAGRGFAVVAEEIRKLAESTAQNSNQIGSSVKEIIEKIHTTSDRSRQTGEAISAIATETEESSSAMEEILQALAEVNMGTQQITEALEHLVSTSSTVKSSSSEVREESEHALEAISKVNNLSTENSQGIAEISNAMEEINISIQQIRDLGIRNRENIKTIHAEVENFKTETEQDASA